MECQLILPGSLYTEELIRETGQKLPDSVSINIVQKKSDYEVILSSAQPDEEIAKKFNNLLINGLHMKLIREENRKMRNAIIAEALALQNYPRDDLSASLSELESDALEDPLGLSEPWQGKQ